MHSIGIDRYRTAERRLRRDDRGVTIVEFGLVAIPLFAIIVAVVQLSITLMTQQILETATEKAARRVMTGQNRSDKVTASAFKDQICKQIPALVPCASLMVDVASYPSLASVNTSNPAITYSKGQPSNKWSYDTGSDGSVVRLRLIYLAPSSFGPLDFTLADQPDGKRLMIATSIFKNESSS